MSKRSCKNTYGSGLFPECPIITFPFSPLWRNIFLHLHETFIFLRLHKTFGAIAGIRIGRKNQTRIGGVRIGRFLVELSLDRRPPLRDSGPADVSAPRLLARPKPRTADATTCPKNAKKRERKKKRVA